MGDNLAEEAEPAPPPPGTNKVEITVAGHTVVVESGDSLEDVVGYALGVFEQTAGTARRIPVGFDTTTVLAERAEPFYEPGRCPPYEGEDAHARRLDRFESDRPALAATRRLAVADTPGGHRARLRPVPVDREQRPLR